MAKFHDITTLLGQLPDLAIRKQLDGKLRGVNLDKLHDDGRKLLHYAAWEGRLDGVRYLVEKGADVNLGAAEFGIARAPALFVAVISSIPSTKVKLALTKLLLDAGTDVNVQLVPEKGLRPFASGFKKGTLLDYVVADALHEDKVSKDASYDAGSRRDSKSQVQKYAATLPLLIAAGATGSPATMKGLAKLGVTAPAKVAKPLDAKWPVKARAKLKNGTRSDAYDVCETFLSRPDAVAHAEWPKLVEEIIGLSKSFEDVAEEVYGKRVSFEDDEGVLAQGWEEHVFLDIVLELLGKSETLANMQWESLVRRVFELRPNYHATDYVPVEEFFEQPCVRSHAAYKNLVAFEKQTRRAKRR